MYIWNLEKVTAEIKNRPFTEAELFPYLMVNVALYGFVAIPLSGDTYTYTLMDSFSAVVYIVATLLGLYYVYRKNGGAAGLEFLPRLLTLGFVYGVRWSVLVAIPVSIVYFFSWEFFSTIPESTTLYDVVFFNVLGIHYFWQLGKHFEKLPKTREVVGI